MYDYTRPHRVLPQPGLLGGTEMKVLLVLILLATVGWDGTLGITLETRNCSDVRK